jgi:hypothetical protein
MSEPKWEFRAMVKGEMNADPIESEFFSVEHLDSVADALVRESIQNSLDAGLAGQTVRVAFRLYTEKSDRNGLMAQYLKGLHPHLNAEQNGLIEAPSSNSPESFLVIEDYGTRGLEGDPAQDDDLQSTNGSNKNDFFYFWRNIGRSKKDSADRGRWGLGKTVFQATSKINTYFGATVRESDGKLMLLGQSVLKTHLVSGVKHSPYGWYGIFNEHFALPIEDRSYLDKFSESFGLKRQGKTGLSIVIPYPDSSVEIQTLLSSALLHYFFPILSKDLVVELNKDGKQLILDEQKVDQLLKYVDFSASRMTKEAFQSLFSFTRWVHSLSSNDLIKINAPSTSVAPKWGESLIDPEILSKLREQFDRRERIAIRVPLTIKPKDKASEKTYFDIFIEHDEKLDRAEDHFVREGITIAGVSTLKQRGIRAVISIKDKALSALLGDSENPAHTEWQERSPKFKNQYIHGVSCLRFVKNSPKEIVKILSKPSLGIDKNLLENFFSITPISKKGAKSLPGEKGSTPDDLMGTTKEFYLIRRKGGFLLKKNPDATKIPSGFHVTVAYEIRGKNPFKIYSPFDFEMDKAPIKVNIKGAQISAIQQNQLIAQINNQDFQFEISGFDFNRDLRVKIVGIG